MNTQQDSMWKYGSVLSFDLKKEKLRKYYSMTSPENAYSVVKKFLKEHDFEHLKDSDYVHHSLNKGEVTELLMEFSLDHKWFPLSKTKIIISPNVQRLDISSTIDSTTDKAWARQKLLEHEKHEAEKQQAQSDLPKMSDLSQSSGMTM